MTSRASILGNLERATRLEQLSILDPPPIPSKKALGSAWGRSRLDRRSPEQSTQMSDHNTEADSDKEESGSTRGESGDVAATRR